MGSEIGQVWQGLRHAEGIKRTHRRLAAARGYPQLARQARQAGMKLRMCSEAHYRLEAQGWAIDIYPGNRRIYNPPGPRRGPFLRLPAEWNLGDVIDAAINVVKGAVP